MRKCILIAAGLALVSSAVLADMFQDAANVKLPAALKNFGYGDALAMSAICTTASGSAAVTGCPSTAGLAAGMRVKGPGIPVGATIKEDITASGFTLSAPATASSATAQMTIRHLPFWSDVDGGAPSIWRFPGRVMIGNAAGESAARYTTPGALTFCPNGTYCYNYGIRDADLAVMSSRGAFAITGMSRTSDGDINGSEVNAPATVGVAGFVVGDVFRTGPASAGWASYWDVQLNPEADGSVMMGMEIALKNRGGNYVTTPYAGQPGIFGIRLSPGGDPAGGGVNVNPVNTGILFGPINGGPSYKFNKGIVFNRLSLVGSDGTTGCCGTALEMAKGHMIAWRSPDNGNGFLIHSEVSAGSAGLQLEAKDNILSVLGDGGSTSALQVINSPAGVNAITISNAVTGDLPAVTAHSITDLNVSLQLKPQGTGTVNPGMGLKLPNYTVATLPTCNAAYTYVTAAVSDATAPAYNGALTGGGAVKIPVMCDGAAWKAH